MSSKKDKTILKTMGGALASGFVMTSVVMQPTGNIKQAVTDYKESIAVNAIQNSALAEEGLLSSPHIARAKAEKSNIQLSTAKVMPNSLPAYTAPGHQSLGVDSEGDDYDLITDGQTVSRDITFNDGTEYTEVNGYKDDQGNYMDELPANAAIGVENTPAVGNGDGEIYAKYTSRDNMTVNFTSGLPSSGAVHGKVNTQSVNGPNIIYDQSDYTWHTVDTGTTVGKVGDGSGGTWTHLQSAASVWPGYGYNPWWGSNGSWNNASRLKYITWLWDHHLSSNSVFYVSGTLLNVMGYERAQKLHNLLWGGWKTTWYRSDFINYFNSAQIYYGNAFLADNLYCIAYGVPGFGQHKYFSTLTMPWMTNVNTTGWTWTMTGSISNYSNRYPNGDGSGDWYDNSRNDDWTYNGPIFYSSYPTSYSGSTTVYGDPTLSSSSSTSGSDFWDSTGTNYSALPVVAEKEGETGKWNTAGVDNQPGVGDESGKWYYQGTRTLSSTQDFKSGTLFTEASRSDGWLEDEVNFPAVGDGSGKTYERALYYYDSSGAMIHTLPTGNWEYADTSGNLFNTEVHDGTFDTTIDRQSGVGTAQVLQWIAANETTLGIKDDFNKNGLGVEWVVTETDTQQKKVIIAIQAAMTLLTGVNTNAGLQTALSNLQLVVDISDTDKDDIATYANTIATSSVTHKLKEGYKHTLDFFGQSREIFGTESDIDIINDFFDGSTLSDFFGVSTDITTLKVEKTSGVVDYVYYDRIGDTVAEQQLALQSVSNTLPLEDVLLSDGLISYFTHDDWGQSVANRGTLSDVRYTDFDYDKYQLTIEAIVHVGDKSTAISEVFTFTNSYMDQIMRELAIDEFIASPDMLSEQPLITNAEYSVGTETEINSSVASFALQDSFIAKFPEPVKLVDIALQTQPTEEQTNVEYIFTIEYEGHQRTYNQSFDFAKTRSQKYVEEATAAITNVATVVSIFDKTILDLTSRDLTLQPFDDFLVADGNTSERMTLSNIQLVGGGDIDRDATSMNITVDVTMGSFTIANHPLALDLNHSVNTELINNLTEDELVAKSPGIVSIVDEFDPTSPEWDDSSWWTIQSTWIEMLDIAGIVVLGNFSKIDERHFSVDLEVTIGNEKKTINVTQKVGFNLNFATDLNESTTGISDPQTLEDFREYMIRFNEQLSVFYVGSFDHAFVARDALDSELLQSWQATVSTLAGDAVIRSIEFTDINAITKYDREVSFKITLEDSLGNTRTFDKIHEFAISPVAEQFDAATASMISTTQNLAGQLEDSVLTQMGNIADYTWLDAHLNLLDTVRVVSVTNTGKTAHVTFEFGYSGHLGDDSKQVSIDYVFDRRGDKDAALLNFGLGYTEAELSAYYDINNVDAAGNDWKNVEQSVLDELIKLAAQSQLRDDAESEIIALHASIFPNVWATQADLQSAIDDITTTDIMALLQAEILAGGTTRATFITDELVEIRNEKMEDLILLDLASNWKLNSATDALNEVLKYNSTFNIQDFYLVDVVTVVENSTFVTDLSLEIAHATLLPQVLDTTLQGVSASTELDYFNAVTAATNNAFVAEYAKNVSAQWVNIDELIKITSDSVSQIIIDAQVSSTSGIINSTTHYNDRTINELIKDLSVFTGEEIKVVGYDVENAGVLDRDSSTFNVEVFLTFGSVVNQRHVFELQLDKSVNQAILDEIKTTDIQLKDFLVKELANELEVAHYDSWDKFGLSSTHVLPEDNIAVTVDSSSFAIVGDVATSPSFTLDFTLTIGTTSVTITSEQRIGIEVVFDLKDVDPNDTELLAYLRTYDVGERVTYNGTWTHPFEVLDALEADENALETALTLYDGLVASGVKINDIYVHNKNGISEFDKTITLKIVAEDKNGTIKLFDKVVTFTQTAAEWAFDNFSEANIVLADANITSGILTDGVKSNILGEKSGYIITNHRDPVHIGEPIVTHSGKTATVSWRVWYDDGQIGGSSNSKVIEIDYVFASRGSKDDALANFGLEYSETDIAVDWNNVDGTNDWTNVEQNVLDELVRGLAETAIRQELEDIILADAAEYSSNVWASLALLQDDINLQTDISTISELTENILSGFTSRTAYLEDVKINMQRDKIEENILEAMQTRWNQSSVETLLGLVSSLNSIIDVKNYYGQDMHTVISSSTYAQDISREMEIDTVRNNVLAHLTVGLNPTDVNYSIYNDVLNAKLEATYDAETASGFLDVQSLIKTLADSVSQEAIDDLLATINYEIQGTVDEGTRVLADIYKNLDAINQAGILHSNIKIANSGTLDFDSTSISLTADLRWGTVTNMDTALTLDLSQTVSQAMINSIQFDEIGLVDQRLAPTSDQIVVADLTSDMFVILSRHILGTDTYGLTIDNTSFELDPVEARDFSIDVTVTIGAETRVITVIASVGFDIDLDWESYNWATATDAQKDMIDFMDSYDFQWETVFTGLHSNPWELRDETNLVDQFSPSRNLVAARGDFTAVTIKDASSITKYDRSLWVIVTVIDKLGVTYDFEKEIKLDESYLETLIDNTNGSHFDVISSIHLTDMLTDQTVTDLSSLGTYDVDSSLNEFDSIELLGLQQSGKAATATFRVSYDDGQGHSGSKIITKEFVFASRGDKDLATANFGLGYTDGQLGIDWNTVDSFGNDWTNVEQDVLDQLVKTTSYNKVRLDIREDIRSNSSGYVDNVFGSVVKLDNAILAFADNAELVELQDFISNNIKTRTEWVNETTTYLQTSNVERMILEALASEWKIVDADSALLKAIDLQPGFDISSYYNNIDALVQSNTFDLDEARQIGYDVFSSITRDHMDIFHSTNDSARDIHYDNVHASLFESKYDENISGSWTQLTDFSELVADSISHQFINDEIIKMTTSVTGYPLVNGYVDLNTRTLSDVRKDFSLLENEFINISNIKLTSSGTALGGDLDIEHIFAGISFGSVVIEDKIFTISLDQTINNAIIEGISVDDIRMTEYRLEGVGTGPNGELTTADINGNDILEWMFTALSPHLRGSDNVEVFLDYSNPFTPVDAAIDPSLRSYTIGIKIVVGNESRDFIVSERLGQLIVFGNIDSTRWGELGIIDAADEQEFITYNDDYPIVESIKYLENFDHVLDVQSAVEQDWINALSPSQYVIGGGLSIVSVDLKDNGTYNKFDKEFTFILTLSDSFGDTKVVEKTIVLAQSTAEFTLEQASASSFAFTDHDNTIAILTDNVLQNILTAQSAFFIDSAVSQYLDVSNPIVEHKGKSVTIGFEVSYDDGSGKVASKVIQIDLVFASRGSKDDAIANYGLGYDDSRLGINWNQVDVFDNDWTNVEQDVLNELVRSAAQYEIRQDVYDDINSASSDYITNVWDGQFDLSQSIASETTFEPLSDLQSEISNSNTTRQEFVVELSEVIRVSKIESVLLSNIATLWRLSGPDDVNDKAVSNKVDFDIKDYYFSSMNTIISSPSFIDTITYQVFEDVYRSDIDSVMLASAEAKDVQKVTDAIDNFISAKIRDVFLQDVWTNDSTIVSHVAHLISEQAINDAMALVGSTLSGTLDRDTRNIKDVAIDFAPLEYEGLYLSNVELNGSVNGEFINRDTTTLPSSVAITFGTIIDRDYLVNVEVGQTLNQAILGSLTSSSITLKDTRLYASVDFMLEKMGEDIASGGSGTITNITYFESVVDYLGRDDAHIAFDPNNTLTKDPSSSRIFSIGLIITAGQETLNLEVTIQVGEAINFTVPEFADGGTFDFNPYFILTTTSYGNPYDLHQIGEEAKDHIDIDPFLKASYVTIEDLIITGNDAIDIFSREFVATFTLKDQRGNLRTFVDQPIVIPGSGNKAESIMALTTDQDIKLVDSTIINGQLTDELLNTTLLDLATYTFGNEIDLLNGLVVKDVSNVGKHATIVFTVGYDDGAGNTDFIEYTYVYEFAYRADVAWSLDYYGIALTVDELGINFTVDQEEGNVEQDVIDNIVIAALQAYLYEDYTNFLQTFVDASILTEQEVSDDVTTFLDAAKMDEIAVDGQTLTTSETITKYKAILTTQAVAKSYDAVAINFLKATDWAEIATAYPEITTGVETSIEASIASNTFDASDIQGHLAYALALEIAPEVQSVIENGSGNLEAWFMTLIGSEKQGFLWAVHSTVEAQLSTGFNDAPKLSDSTSGIHVNEQSANGWFVDEISHLTSFSAMNDYILHLSTKLARLEIPAEITEAHLIAARESLKQNIAAEIQTIIDEGIISLEDIDNYLDVLLYVDEDHPQGFPFANYDAVFTPSKYFSESGTEIVIEQLTHSGTSRAADVGLSTVTGLLAKTAVYIKADGADLVVTQQNASSFKSETMDEYRSLHIHYTHMLKNNVYEVSYLTYLQTATNNLVSSFNAFLFSYVSKMDVYLSDLENLSYDDQLILDTQIDFIASRVDQIQNKPDIQATIDLMIVGLGLDQSKLDDSAYKDLLKFTITKDELEAHLFSEALLQILETGGPVDKVVDGLTTRPTDVEIAEAGKLLEELMEEEYPANEAKLDITIKSAFLFVRLNDSYYAEVIDLYNSKVEGQTPEWKPIATIEEAKEVMKPIVNRIFEELYNETLDFDDALIEVEESKEEISVALAWSKYEEAFMGLFEKMKQEAGVERLTVQEMTEYATVKLNGFQSLSHYIQVIFHDGDQATLGNGFVPSTSVIETHMKDVISKMIDYAQERYNTFLSDVAKAASLTVQEVVDKSTIADEVVLIQFNGTESIGGTSTEIKALRAQIGKYVFSLMIEESVKPDPQQNVNGWLIPFAALITKTDDYSKITEIIQERIDDPNYVDGSFENWGFEGIADIMNALVDTNVEQETYNAETGKIIMDKFVRANDSTTNAWSTTMWLGPIPLRMTYGIDGDISAMQTILMDREDPERINDIALSTHYSQKEMTLRLGMTDGTTVYVRYVEDADTHVNVILQRINPDGTWETSEMYREANLSQDISRKTYNIYRDSNLASFKNLPSEFESRMIPIFGKGVDLNNITVNQSTSSNSLIEHVWGDNPTVDSSMNITASSTPAVVKKDDEGNTHIQMHQKDIKVENTSAAITATITAGGFTLMWLIWTFLTAITTIGVSGISSGVIFVTRRERKRKFVLMHPEYDGASTSKVLKLKKLFEERLVAKEDYRFTQQVKVKDNPELSLEEAKLREDIELTQAELRRGAGELLVLQDIEAKIAHLEALALSESEVHKFRKGFMNDLKTMEDNEMTLENIERAAAKSSVLEERTRIANKALGGKYVENATHEFKAKQNIKMKKDVPLIKDVKDVPKRTAPAPKKITIVEDGLTIREIEDGLRDINYLESTTTSPIENNPRACVNFEPFEKMGLTVERVGYHQANISKNSREHTLSILFAHKAKNIAKTVKVVFPQSINENVINNIDQYSIDTTGLARFKNTSDPTFKESNIRDIFKSSAPNARLTFVRRSLEIHGPKSFSGRLRVTIGSYASEIPFTTNF